MEATTNKLLLSCVQDLFSLCEKYSEKKFSSFLDGGSLAYIEDNAIIPYGFNVMFFGGHPDSGKKIMGVFPEWCEAEEELFPISTLRIELCFSGTLSHRDYLGALLSLGLDVSKFGDILVDSEKSAYCFVCSDISDYVCQNISKIGPYGVKIKKIPFEDVKDVKRNFEHLSLVCAAERTDAVVGAITKLSRQKAADLISSGKVKINHRLAQTNAALLKEGDLISVRGFGRFIFRGTGTKTRKNRLHINIDKYI